MLLLILRRANRTRHAWLILVPLLVVYLLVSLAQNILNAYFLFYLHQFICLTIGDLLKFFAVSVAVVLAVSDLIARVQNRQLRFLLMLLVLFLAGGFGIMRHAWPMLSPHAWLAFFGVFLLVFAASHSLVNTLLCRFTGRERFRWWHMGFCLVYGLCPIVILGTIQAVLDQSFQLMSSFEFYRTSITLSAAICLPYFVFFWFVLLAMASPFCRQRLAQGFGVNLSSRFLMD